ncbi:MAG TPA: UDP-glucose/GDP-mannose dehydrogenase family protein [Thermomicrobiales bacterium]|nr:UDP-glucose/GDP-mannose dehydrogenase family protein [Thermomicrobiales bacterium]
MRITIFGTGYVGLVTGACFAESGNHVCCVDVDAGKIAALQRGEIPIYEPGLAELVEQNSQAGRLTFTTDAAQGIDHGVIIFIAVGTPQNPDGSSDLRFVHTVAETIGTHLSKPALIVNKSTVPVGTADMVRDIINDALRARGVSPSFDVISNPEFLKEGAAIDDFLRPDRIIIGAESTDSIELMRQLYHPFNRNHNRIIVMDTRSAELTKYAANAMLATKISFMNEIANIAERTGANIESIRIGIGSDSRIGYNNLYAGIGYGGSCFPKDIRALQDTALKHDYHAEFLGAIEEVNERQKRVLLDKILDHYDGNIEGKTFALWGLAFKPKTDDVRDAPSRVIMEGLWERGARVRAYDPEATQTTRTLYGDRADLVLCDTRDEAVIAADALVICTEWRQFKSPDWDLLRRELTEPVIFDGRNIYDPVRMRKEGFAYYGIGLGERSHDSAPEIVHTSPLLAQAALAD